MTCSIDWKKTDTQNNMSFDFEDTVLPLNLLIIIGLHA